MTSHLSHHHLFCRMQIQTAACRFSHRAIWPYICLSFSQTVPGLFTWWITQTHSQNRSVVLAFFRGSFYRAGKACWLFSWAVISFICQEFMIRVWKCIPVCKVAGCISQNVLFSLTSTAKKILVCIFQTKLNYMLRIGRYISQLFSFSALTDWISFIMTRSQDKQPE